MKLKKTILSLGLSVAMLAGVAVSATAQDTVKMEDLFAVKGVTVKVANEYTDFVMTGEKAEITFNRSLASDGFSLSFAGVNKNTLQKVDFVLTDSEQESISAKLNFLRMNDKYTAVALNDSNRSYITNGSMYLENDADFYFTYNADSKVLTDSNSYTVAVSSNTDGSAFTGFASHLVNLKIELTGKKGSIFRLKEINRQRIGSDYENDTVEPMITVVGGVDAVTKGSKVSLPTAFASDVLSDTASVTMTVKNPDSDVVTSTDGKKLENVTPDKAYEIAIDMYGDYRIEYQATDGKNATRIVSSQIRVADDSKPEITLAQALPTEAKVGEELTLPELTYTDNVTAKDQIVSWAVAAYPSGKICGVKDSLVFEEKGQYRLTFYAMDEEGNVRSLSQTIYVKGE